MCFKLNFVCPTWTQKECGRKQLKLHGHVTGNNKSYRGCKELGTIIGPGEDKNRNMTSLSEIRIKLSYNGCLERAGTGPKISKASWQTQPADQGAATSRSWRLCPHSEPAGQPPKAMGQVWRRHLSWHRTQAVQGDDFWLQEDDYQEQETFTEVYTSQHSSKHAAWSSKK